MFIYSCIGDLCHITVVDPCYVLWGVSLCPLWVLHGSSVNLSIYSLVKSEYVSFPIGLDMC